MSAYNLSLLESLSNQGTSGLCLPLTVFFGGHSSTILEHVALYRTNFLTVCVSPHFFIPPFSLPPLASIFHFLLSLFHTPPHSIFFPTTSLPPSLPSQIHKPTLSSVPFPFQTHSPPLFSPFPTSLSFHLHTPLSFLYFLPPLSPFPTPIPLSRPLHPPTFLPSSF